MECKMGRGMALLGCKIKEIAQVAKKIMKQQWERIMFLMCKALLETQRVLWISSALKKCSSASESRKEWAAN